MGRKEHSISMDTFSKMKSLFNQKIKPNLGENYSDSSWQSLQDIKEFLAFVEKEANEKEIDISGIRFQYIAKESENQQLTFAMVPTYDNENGEHIDFDPLFSSNKKPKNIQDISKDDPNYTKIGSIMNRGFNCPPECDPTKK